jgi:hypothetical protein
VGAPESIDGTSLAPTIRRHAGRSDRGPQVMIRNKQPPPSAGTRTPRRADACAGGIRDTRTCAPRAAPRAATSGSRSATTTPRPRPRRAGPGSLQRHRAHLASLPLSESIPEPARSQASPSIQRGRRYRRPSRARPRERKRWWLAWPRRGPARTPSR